MKKWIILIILMLPFALGSTKCNDGKYPCNDFGHSGGCSYNTETEETYCSASACLSNDPATHFSTTCPKGFDYVSGELEQIDWSVITDDVSDYVEEKLEERFGVKIKLDDKQSDFKITSDGIITNGEITININNFKDTKSIAPIKEGFEIIGGKIEEQLPDGSTLDITDTRARLTENGWEVDEGAVFTSENGLIRYKSRYNNTKVFFTEEGKEPGIYITEDSILFKGVNGEVFMIKDGEEIRIDVSDLESDGFFWLKGKDIFYNIDNGIVEIETPARIATIENNELKDCVEAHGDCPLGESELELLFHHDSQPAKLMTSEGISSTNIQSEIIPFADPEDTENSEEEMNTENSAEDITNASVDTLNPPKISIGSNPDDSEIDEPNQSQIKDDINNINKTKTTQNTDSGTASQDNPTQKTNKESSVALKKYINAPDTDNDGIPDNWETEHGLDPDDPVDAVEFNADGITYKAQFEEEMQELKKTEESSSVWPWVLLVLIILFVAGGTYIKIKLKQKPTETKE